MPLLRTNREIAEIYERHFDTVFRVCFAYMKNNEDSSDAASDTFLRLMKSAPAFDNEDHEKAWLIRTASNVCKNTLRHWWRRNENLEDHEDTQAAPPPEIDGAMDAVMSLPNKYKSLVYLYYYEGYDSGEISEILNKPRSTIRYHLFQARKILRDKLGGDFR